MNVSILEVRQISPSNFNLLVNFSGYITAEKLLANPKYKLLPASFEFLQLGIEIKIVEQELRQLQQMQQLQDFLFHNLSQKLAESILSTPGVVTMKSEAEVANNLTKFQLQITLVQDTEEKDAT
jgi:hypothetical protein